MFAGIDDKLQRKLIKLQMNENEWELVKIIIKCLKPFYHATVILSGRNYPTLSLSTFIQNNIHTFFDNLLNEHSKPTITYSQRKNAEIVNEIANILIQYMNKYFVDKPTAKEKSIILVGFTDNFI